MFFSDAQLVLVSFRDRQCRRDSTVDIQCRRCQLVDLAHSLWTRMIKLLVRCTQRSRCRIPTVHWGRPIRQAKRDPNITIWMILRCVTGFLLQWLLIKTTCTVRKHAVRVLEEIFAAGVAAYHQDFVFWLKILDFWGEIAKRAPLQYCNIHTQ